jgi:hypothetical protein
MIWVEACLSSRGSAFHFANPRPFCCLGNAADVLSKASTIPEALSDHGQQRAEQIADLELVWALLTGKGTLDRKTPRKDIPREKKPTSAFESHADPRLLNAADLSCGTQGT